MRALRHCVILTNNIHADGILIYANPPGAAAVPLAAAWELESFGWLQRGTVQDVMAFMSKVSTIVRMRSEKSAATNTPISSYSRL